jgi:hypothetical protein
MENTTHAVILARCFACIFGLQNCGTFYGTVPAVAQLVEALRYKSEGRGFDSGWSQWSVSLT